MRLVEAMSHLNCTLNLQIVVETAPFFMEIPYMIDQYCIPSHRWYFRIYMVLVINLLFS